jgi:DNA-binding response OmpR family regulator
MRAIVMDDDEGVRGMIEQVLKRRGYEVISFEAPDQCPLLQAHACACGPAEVCADLLISDVNMPHVSGLQFVEGQKKKGCKLRCIAFMSGRWEEPDLEQARRLGCKVFYKPFHLQELYDWLAECEKSSRGVIKLSDWFLSKKNGFP